MTPNEILAREIVNQAHGRNDGAIDRIGHTSIIVTSDLIYLTARVLDAKDKAMAAMVEVMQGLADMGNVGAQGALAKLRGEP